MLKKNIGDFLLTILINLCKYMSTVRVIFLVKTKGFVELVTLIPPFTSFNIRPPGNTYVKSGDTLAKALVSRSKTLASGYNNYEIC